MVFYLILSCTALSLIVSLLAMYFFSKPIRLIIASILPHDLVDAWSKYMRYMIVVIGLGGGVRVYRYEQYLDTANELKTPLVLTPGHWALELYETLLQTLSSIGWLIFWLFAIAMIAYVILKACEKRKVTEK